MLLEVENATSVYVVSGFFINQFLFLRQDIKESQ